MSEHTPGIYGILISVRLYSEPGINGLREHLIKWTNQKEGIMMFWMNPITNTLPPVLRQENSQRSLCPTPMRCNCNLCSKSDGHTTMVCKSNLNLCSLRSFPTCFGRQHAFSNINPSRSATQCAIKTVHRESNTRDRQVFRKISEIEGEGVLTCSQGEKSSSRRYYLPKYRSDAPRAFAKPKA